MYPKNKAEGEDTEKELVDENGDLLPPRPAGAYDCEVGQQFHYGASFVIPSQIGELVNGALCYTKLEFNDAVDQTGVRFEGIDQIVMNGTPIDVNQFTGAQMKRQIIQMMALTSLATLYLILR